MYVQGADTSQENVHSLLAGAESMQVDLFHSANKSAQVTADRQLVKERKRKKS